MLISAYNKTILQKLAMLVIGLLLILGMAPTAFATTAELADWDSLCVYGDESLENTVIRPQTLNGETYLVLPSNVSPNAVNLRLETGEAAVVTVKGAQNAVELNQEEALDLIALCGEGDSCAVTLEATDGTDISEYSLKVLFSANIGAMYLVSDDPVNEGRAWVESSPDKSNKATGSMVLQSADGTVVYDGALTQIKGRGNSTWNGAKKPYQIKLDKKTDLLQTGNDDNKTKTWVLLANYSDLSLLRNTLALDLGIAMRMDSSVESEHIDLYYDGEYRGSYLLSEKVEIGSGRVDITDMEELNEEANPDTDLEDFSISTGTTANGASYTYCVDMASPADITGGYLLEMEASYRAVAEACYFWTTRGEYVVVKSPEFCSREQMEYIASVYQEYEDALYNDGVNPTTGKRYTEYVDLQSTAQCYLINELAKNLDGFRTSAYLYKEAGEDIMTMGPLWDYDLGFGVGAGIQEVVKLQKDPEGLYTVRSIFGAVLYNLGDFRVAAKEEWENNLYPLLTGVVFGDEAAVSEDGNLRSITYYRSELLQSAVCDYVMWRGLSDSGHWLNQVDYFDSYVRARAQSLNEILPQWNAETCEPVSAFVDVELDDWYGETVHKAKEYGLMQGVGASIEHYPLFDPDGTATRAAVARTIYNMEGPEAAEYENPFTDVPEGQWYTDAVCWGAENGVIQGYPDSTYRPDSEITREDLITLLYRYSGMEAPDSDELSKFDDAASVSHYAVEAMEWAITEQIIEGYLDNTLKPQATTDRAELATLLVRFYERYLMNAE